MASFPLMKKKIRVLLLSPYFDKNTPGESWSNYKWVQGISRVCDTTVLTCHRKGWKADTCLTKASRIVNWSDPDLPGMNGRFAWELKPGYFFFYAKARRWIRQALRRGDEFEIAHQIGPLALRYPTPLRSMGIPYLIGPLAGSLQTPVGFRDDAREKLWYRNLRSIDRLRLAYDPWLRKGYSGAESVLGAAPYVRDLILPCNPRRFEVMSETGVTEIADTPVDPPQSGEPLRLIFVGRIIRTKGILDAIKALGRCGKLVNFHFDVVGDGDLLDHCVATARDLHVLDRIAFHGRRKKMEVQGLLRKSHVFLFPSFREPSGNVVFEAMSQGLPVITSDVGGPGYVVDESCGFRIAPSNPERYSSDLADAIKKIAGNPDIIQKLSIGALAKMRDTALWPNKIDRLIGLYNEILPAGRHA